MAVFVRGLALVENASLQCFSVWTSEALRSLCVSLVVVVVVSLHELSEGLAQPHSYLCHFPFLNVSSPDPSHEYWIGSEDPNTKGSVAAYMTQLPVTPLNFPVQSADIGTNSAMKIAIYTPGAPTGMSVKVPGVLAPRSVRP